MRKRAACLAAGGVVLSFSTALRAQTYLGNVVALGDSITEGKYSTSDISPDLSGGYRQYLQDDLAAVPDRNYTFYFVGQEDNGRSDHVTGFSTGMSDPNNEGFGSFTINDLIYGASLEQHTSIPLQQNLSNTPTDMMESETQSANLPAGDNDHSLPKIVLLMIGTNDALSGSATPSGMAANLNTLISDILVDDPTVELFVSNILPVNPVSTNNGPPTSPATLATIQGYDALIPGIVAGYSSSGYHVNFVDNYSTINPYTQTSDSVHPTYSGYQQIAQSWTHAIDEVYGASTNAGTPVTTYVNTSTVTFPANQPWPYGSIFVNSFDSAPGANLNATTAIFQSDSGSSFSNLFVSADTGTIIFQTTQHLSALTVGVGAQVQVTASTSGHQSVIYVWQYFVNNGVIDLTNNAMDVQNSNLAAITAMVQSGFANSSAPGSIISSSIAADSKHLTTLGVISNNVSGAALYGSGAPMGLFDGNTYTGTSDVLVKYTYFGDTNLDGKVDGSDYSRVDNGYLTGATGWYNGDFNYDGKVDGSDYTLMDNAFNQQGSQLDALIANPLVTITAQIAVDSSPAPEPSGLILAAATSLAMIRRRTGPKIVARRRSR